MSMKVCKANIKPLCMKWKNIDTNMLFVLVIMYAKAIPQLQYDNKYKDIPILMITARSQEEDKIIGEETGADEYITKPFNVDYVVEKVKSYLEC